MSLARHKRQRWFVHANMVPEKVYSNIQASRRPPLAGEKKPRAVAMKSYNGPSNLRGRGVSKQSGHEHGLSPRLSKECWLRKEKTVCMMGCEGGGLAAGIQLVGWTPRWADPPSNPIRPRRAGSEGQPPESGCDGGGEGIGRPGPGQGARQDAHPEGQEGRPQPGA